MKYLNTLMLFALLAVAGCGNVEPGKDRLQLEFDRGYAHGRLDTLKECRDSIRRIKEGAQP